jgi:hypothetical membrane protein
LLVSIPLGLFGLGLVGIGIFSGDKTPYHGMFAMLAFLSGGFSAIATSAKITSAPFKYIGFYLVRLHYLLDLPPRLSQPSFFLISALAGQKDG